MVLIIGEISYQFDTVFKSIFQYALKIFEKQLKSLYVAAEISRGDVNKMLCNFSELFVISKLYLL